MNAKIIDGKACAALLRGEVQKAATDFEHQKKRKAGLAVVLVGDDPASKVYVGSKLKQTAQAGMLSFEHRLGADVSQGELHALLDKLNADEAVDGILVQLPLPGHLDSAAVLLNIRPDKDVDGLHPENAGRLSSGLPGLVPCTPLGSVMLLKTVHAKFDGMNALVIGRSNLVGKPIAQLLLAENATVTIAHSKTRDLEALARSADILIAAIGRPHFVKGDWIKQGASVIDVGINRITRDGKPALCGDVDFDEAVKRAGAITPVPGGVGPMTVACLLANTLTAATRRAGFAPPVF